MEQLEAIRVEYAVVCYPFRPGWPSDSRIELIHGDPAEPRHLHKPPVTRIYRVPPRKSEDAQTAALGDRPS